MQNLITDTHATTSADITQEILVYLGFLEDLTDLPELSLKDISKLHCVVGQIFCPPTLLIEPVTTTFRIPCFSMSAGLPSTTFFGRAKAASDKKVPVVPVVVPLYRDPVLEIRAMVLPPKILGQRRGFRAGSHFL